MPARPTALPAPSSGISGVTFRRAPATPIAVPITVTSTPTVLTSQMSHLGPVTFWNVPMLTSGHRPVRMYNAACVSATAENRRLVSTGAAVGGCILSSPLHTPRSPATHLVPAVPSYVEQWVLDAGAMFVPRAMRRLCTLPSRQGA